MNNRIVEDLAVVSGLDRTVGSNGYNAAADYIYNRINACEKIELRRIYIDPNLSYGTWQFPASIRHWMDGRKEQNITYNLNRSIQIIEARIRGKSQQEIIFVTHFCHPSPGANDNASGVAGQLALCDHYSRVTPEMTLVFLFTAEYWGTIAWAINYNFRNTLGGISLDMLGGGARNTGSALIVDEIPLHLDSSLDLLLFHSLKKYAPATRYRMIGDSVRSSNVQLVRGIGGSDHSILNDVSFSVPSTCLNTFPDPYYHTKYDTVDKVDPDSILAFIYSINELVDCFGLTGFKPTSYQLLMWFISKVESIRQFSLDDVLDRNILLNYLIRKSAKKLLGSPTLHERHFVCLAREILNDSEINYSSNVDRSNHITYRKNYVGPLYRNTVYKELPQSLTEEIANAYEKNMLVYVYLENALNLVFSAVTVDDAHVLSSWYTTSRFDKNLLTRFINELRLRDYISCR